MKIGVTGCSNSHTAWGNPWWYFLGKKFDAEIISSSSPGGGNEMNIEKMKYILEENSDLDYFVVQLTQSGRMVVGLNDWYDENAKNIHHGFKMKSFELDTKFLLHASNGFNGVAYYSFNNHNNENNLKRLLKKDVEIDDLLIEHFFMSNYNINYKIFHTMMSMQHLCDAHNVKLIFFSWFNSLEELSQNSGHQKTLERMNVLPGNVFDFTKEKNIKPIPEDGHFDSEAHERIFEEFIYPHIKNIIKQ
jgi:hypothetical protein